MVVTLTNSCPYKLAPSWLNYHHRGLLYNKVSLIGGKYCCSVICTVKTQVSLLSEIFFPKQVYRVWTGGTGFRANLGLTGFQAEMVLMVFLVWMAYQGPQVWKNSIVYINVCVYVCISVCVFACVYVCKCVYMFVFPCVVEQLNFMNFKNKLIEGSSENVNRRNFEKIM
jgi:hypothetical protein